jgi:Fungal trichothecene efflux pump (TRI12)
LLLPVPHQPLKSLPLRQKFEEVDFLGAFFLLPAIVCLLLALQWGGTIHAWNSSVIIGLFVGFGVMIIIFVIIQIKRGDKATLPLSVLKQRTVASACLFMFFMGASIFIMIYYSMVSSY